MPSAQGNSGICRDAADEQRRKGWYHIEPEKSPIIVSIFGGNAATQHQRFGEEMSSRGQPWAGLVISPTSSMGVFFAHPCSSTLQKRNPGQ